MSVLSFRLRGLRDFRLGEYTLSFGHGEATKGPKSDNPLRRHCGIPDHYTALDKGGFDSPHRPKQRSQEGQGEFSEGRGRNEGLGVFIHHDTGDARSDPTRPWWKGQTTKTKWLPTFLFRGPSSQTRFPSPQMCPRPFEETLVPLEPPVPCPTRNVERNRYSPST